MGVIGKISKAFDAIESEVTLELDEVVFSKKHQHDICVMRVVGKNIFPKMTAEEVLSNKKARAGLSKDDLIIITRLDMEVQLKKKRLKIVEYDRNGTILLKNACGRSKRYTEDAISMRPDLLNGMKGVDSHMIGYRKGFKDGIELEKNRKAVRRLKKFLHFPYKKL